MIEIRIENCLGEVKASGTTREIIKDACGAVVALHNSLGNCNDGDGKFAQDFFKEMCSSGKLFDDDFVEAVVPTKKEDVDVIKEYVKARKNVEELKSKIVKGE